MKYTTPEREAIRKHIASPLSTIEQAESFIGEAHYHSHGFYAFTVGALLSFFEECSMDDAFGEEERVLFRRMMHALIQDPQPGEETPKG